MAGFRREDFDGEPEGIPSFWLCAALVLAIVAILVQIAQ